MSMCAPVCFVFDCSEYPFLCAHFLSTFLFSLFLFLSLPARQSMRPQSKVPRCFSDLIILCCTALFSVYNKWRPLYISLIMILFSRSSSFFFIFFLFVDFATHVNSPTRESSSIHKLGLRSSASTNKSVAMKV